MPGSAHRMLLIAGRESTPLRLVHRLSDRGRVCSAPDLEGARRHLEAGNLDVVVVDGALAEAGAILAISRRLQPHAVRVLVGFEPSAALRAGAERLVLLPLRDAEAAEVVCAAAAEGRLRRENARLEAVLRRREAEVDEAVGARTQALQEALAVATEEAVRDGLTGLYNYRFFQEALAKAIAAARRRRDAVSLLFIDLDLFKPYNDTYGHPAGDRVLAVVGRLLAGPEDGGGQEGRASDVAARYGGDEFVLLLPGTDREGAAIVGERLRRRIEATPFPTPEGPPTHLTASLGVAAWPDDAKDRLGLVEAADRGLYEAKRAGRNCVRRDPRSRTVPRTDGRPHPR